ncbi:MAG: 5'-methylthioadenosine/adenosylhomocysteine nucleosidase [Geminicoccaceae bacterium]
MPKETPLGVICAMPEEIEHLSAAIDRQEERREVGPSGFAFREGRLDGHPVVLVEAGIGKVNAALVATLLLDRFGCHGLILSGVAGGLDPSLGIGDVVVAERLLQHDYGAVIDQEIRPYRPGITPIGESEHPLAYELDAELRRNLELALDGLDLSPIAAIATGDVTRRPQLRFGTVLTGDQFINCETTRGRLFARFGAQAVEMEGAAVAQIAERFDVPCVIVRSLSDLAGAESHMDIRTFLSLTAGQAASVVRRIIPAI